MTKTIEMKFDECGIRVLVRGAEAGTFRSLSVVGLLVEAGADDRVCDAAILLPRNTEIIDFGDFPRNFSSISSWLSMEEALNCPSSDNLEQISV